MINFIARLIERANHKDAVCEREILKDELFKERPAKHIKIKGEYATLREVSLLLWDNEAFDDVYTPVEDLMICRDNRNVRFYEFTPELDPTDPEVRPYLKVI